MIKKCRILVIMSFCLFPLTSSAESVRALAFGFQFGGEMASSAVSGYVTSPKGVSSALSVYLPMSSTWDLGLRTRLFTSLVDSVGVGGSLDAIFRWFPFTYNRMPEFKSGNQELNFSYWLMPYLGIGLGVDLESVQKADLAKFLAVFPRSTFVLGTYVPINHTIALSVELNASYGENFGVGAFYVRAISASASLGLAIFY